MNDGYLPPVIVLFPVVVVFPDAVVLVVTTGRVVLAGGGGILRPVVALRCGKYEGRLVDAFVFAVVVVAGAGIACTTAQMMAIDETK